MSDVAGIIALLDKHTPKGALERIRMSPAEVRRAAARSALAGRRKGGRLPEHVVRAMHADYLNLCSTDRAGALYRRCGDALQKVFTRRGLPMIKPAPSPTKEYRGTVFHRDPHGQYRKAVMVNGRRSTTWLHRVMWTDLHGPIPAGHEVTFADFDRDNVTPANLICLPKAEVGSRSRRRYLARKGAK